MTATSNTWLKRFVNKLLFSDKEYKHIAPLAIFRIAFGAIMLISTIRFLLKGWVYNFYVLPKLFFPFYGFEWIKPLPETGMYLVFAIMLIASLCIMIGFFYRIAIITFFISFVYVELIDKTYYLNHYYVISIITFLLLFVPAQRYFSVDVFRKPSLKVTHVPAWTIDIFKWQICLIYFFAGIAKLNYDWLFRAMPLKIWLPANGYLPVIGPLLTQVWIAYLFSWFGALFDLTVWYLLLRKQTRNIAYIVVVIFHVFTGWLFTIGMFPYIMIFITIIFFSEDLHIRAIHFLQNIFYKKEHNQAEQTVYFNFPEKRQQFLYGMLAVYMATQIILPFRYLLYPGDLYWTEEGYRFSWRVMLMEKGGTTFFHVKDPKTGTRIEIMNAQYLTPFQEKMMETQPDMILQYAHFIHDEYKKKWVDDPIVTVESYVTLNGSGSMLYIDSTVDLSKEKENFLPKKWVRPFSSQ
jgi:hypothetical protein